MESRMAEEHQVTDPECTTQLQYVQGNQMRQAVEDRHVEPAKVISADEPERKEK